MCATVPCTLREGVWLGFSFWIMEKRHRDLRKITFCWEEWRKMDMGKASNYDQVVHPSSDLLNSNGKQSLDQSRKMLPSHWGKGSVVLMHSVSLNYVWVGNEGELKSLWRCGDCCFIFPFLPELYFWISTLVSAVHIYHRVERNCRHLFCCKSIFRCFVGCVSNTI